jgi:outer membrane protein assembly factor BamE (lipoprotein component of BamABCDE complex)
VSYAARIGKDDKLIAVEQRLTRENLAKLKPGAARESDVRDLLGPPNRIDPFPRLQRDAWTYQAQGINPQLIIVQFSKDGVVREAFMIDDPDAMDRSNM